MSLSSSPSGGRRWPVARLLALALALVGCGPPSASVTGTVTFKSQPLPSGTVLFYGPDGRVEHALIGADGQYIIPSAPLGLVHIAVRSHPEAPPGMPGARKPPRGPTGLIPPTEERRDRKYIAIPPRYLDPDQSGLTCTVLAGSQRHDLALQP